MSEQFLLPCECGESIKVTQRDAGKVVQCVCGQSVSAPTLREIKSLEPVSHSQSEDNVKRRNQPTAVGSAARVVLTVLGGISAIVLAIAICCLGYFGYLRSRVVVETTYEREMALQEQQLLSETPGQLWAETLRIQQVGLGAKIPPEFHRKQIEADTIENYLFVTGTVAASALGLLVIFAIAGRFASTKESQATSG